MHPGSKWYAFWMLVNIIQKQGNENKYGQPFKKCKKKNALWGSRFQKYKQSQQVFTYILTLTFYPTYTVVYLMYYRRAREASESKGGITRKALLSLSLSTESKISKSS